MDLSGDFEVFDDTGALLLDVGVEGLDGPHDVLYEDIPLYFPPGEGPQLLGPFAVIARVRIATALFRWNCRLTCHCAPAVSAAGLVAGVVDALL